MRERIESQTAWGTMSALLGMMLYADAIGTGRAYGYTAGNVFEFVMGTMAVIAGTVLLYLASTNRKHMALASSDRRGRRIHSVGCSRLPVASVSAPVQSRRG